MDQRPVQGGVAILLGMLLTKKSGISSGRLGLWLVCAFTFYLPGCTSSLLSLARLRVQDLGSPDLISTAWSTSCFACCILGFLDLLRFLGKFVSLQRFSFNLELLLCTNKTKPNKNISIKLFGLSYRLECVWHFWFVLRTWDVFAAKSNFPNLGARGKRFRDATTGFFAK